MKRDPGTYDRLARRLIQSVEKDLREFLGVPRLEQELVAILYLRLRHLVEACDEDGAVDELALAIFLTASAWQANDEPPVDLLPSLHQNIGATLTAELNAVIN